MADIKVELSGEDINKAIAEAIVKSVLGDTIVKMVNEYVKSISTSYDNPVKKVIEAETKTIISKLLVAHIPTIEAEVAKQMTSDVVSRVTANALDKIQKAY